MTDSEDAGRPEPDGYRVKMQEDEDWAYIWSTENIPEEVEFDDKGPLFSAETIKDAARFEQKARDIEDLARRLETAIADTYDREELLELISEFHDKADEISELEEVFSGNE